MMRLPSLCASCALLRGKVSRAPSFPDESELMLLKVNFLESVLLNQILQYSNALSFYATACEPSLTNNCQFRKLTKKVTD